MQQVIIFMIIGIMLCMLISSSAGGYYITTTTTPTPTTTSAPTTTSTTSTTTTLPTTCLGHTLSSYVDMGSTMGPEVPLKQCQAIVSPDKTHMLAVQSDGNVVEYNTTNGKILCG